MMLGEVAEEDCDVTRLAKTSSSDKKKGNIRALKEIDERPFPDEFRYLASGSVSLPVTRSTQYFLLLETCDNGHILHPHAIVKNQC
jgi:hypothetical protein